MTTVVERTLRVEGDEGLGRRPKPDLLAPVFSQVRSSLLDAVRMGFLHSSRASGRVPGYLDAAADARFVGVEGDGDRATLLHFEIQTLGSSAGEAFKQPTLWFADDFPRPDETAFELFGSALRDVRIGRQDSSSFDPGLLSRIRKYDRVLRRGISCIEMPDTDPERRGTIDSGVVSAASRLSAITPHPRRVRIAGRIDVLAANRGLLKIEVSTGQVVTGLWEGDGHIDSLAHWFNRDVALEGRGVFKPSGALLRIDADHISPARLQDDLFRKVPTGETTRDYRRLAQLRPGEPSAYSRLIKSVDIDVTDEEFESALAQLR